MGYAWKNYTEATIKQVEEMLLDNYEPGTLTANEMAKKIFDLLQPESIAC